MVAPPLTERPPPLSRRSRRLRLVAGTLSVCPNLCPRRCRVETVQDHDHSRRCVIRPRHTGGGSQAVRSDVGAIQGTFTGTYLARVAPPNLLVTGTGREGVATHLGRLELTDRIVVSLVRRSVPNCPLQAPPRFSMRRCLPPTATASPFRARVSDQPDNGQGHRRRRDHVEADGSRVPATASPSPRTSTRRKALR